MNQKTVVEIPLEELNSIKQTLNKILEATQNVNTSDKEDTIGRKDFMAKAGIGHNKMNQLLRSGKLKFFRLGKRTISIPTEELIKYKRGEIL